ncbi:MAG TPA: hypothetical protein VF814_05510, partial [Casimicrobiaceae bacterium]
MFRAYTGAQALEQAARGGVGVKAVGVGRDGHDVMPFSVTLGGVVRTERMADQGVMGRPDGLDLWMMHFRRII